MPRPAEPSIKGFLHSTPPRTAEAKHPSFRRSAVFRGTLLAILLALLLIIYLAPSSFSKVSHFRRPPVLPKLYSATLQDLASGLQKGHFTSQDLVRTYLARIAEVQDEFHAVIETNPHALAEAKLLDEARKRSNVPFGLWHGIPILIKDNIATARPELVLKSCFFCLTM